MKAQQIDIALLDGMSRLSGEKSMDTLRDRQKVRRDGSPSPGMRHGACRQ